MITLTYLSNDKERVSAYEAIKKTMFVVILIGLCMLICTKNIYAASLFELSEGNKIGKMCIRSDLRTNTHYTNKETLLPNKKVPIGDPRPSIAVDIWKWVGTRKFQNRPNYDTYWHVEYRNGKKYEGNVHWTGQSRGIGKDGMYIQYRFKGTLYLAQ